MKKFVLAILRAYQKFISPTLASSCRFYPNCSQYAIEAVEEHGAGSIFMIIKRIISCNPYNKGGYDPVPKRRNECSQ